MYGDISLMVVTNDNGDISLMVVTHDNGDVWRYKSNGGY